MSHGGVALQDLAQEQVGGHGRGQGPGPRDTPAAGQQAADERFGDEAGARPGGKIDEYVAAAVADAFNHLLVERALHARPRCLGIAHMDVNNCRPGLGGVQRRLGDLRRRHRYRRIAAGRIGRSRHGA